QVLLAAQRVGQPGAAHQERVTRPGYGGAETEGFAGRFGQVGEGGRGLVGAGRRREAEVHGEAVAPGGLGGRRAEAEDRCAADVGHPGFDVLPLAVPQPEQSAGSDAEEDPGAAFGVGGEQQAAEAGRVGVRFEALFDGVGAEPAEAAVGEAVESGLEVAAPGGPDVVDQAGVAAAAGPADPPADLVGRAVRPGGGARTGRDGDEHEGAFAAAEAGGEQGVPAGFAPVAGGVAARGGGPQGGGAVAGAVQHGVGDQVVEGVRFGRGQGGGLGVVGGRPGADVAADRRRGGGGGGGGRVVRDVVGGGGRGPGVGGRGGRFRRRGAAGRGRGGRGGGGRRRAGRFRRRGAAGRRRGGRGDGGRRGWGRCGCRRGRPGRGGWGSRGGRRGPGRPGGREGRRARRGRRRGFPGGAGRGRAGGGRDGRGRVRCPARVRDAGGGGRGRQRRPPVRQWRPRAHRAGRRGATDRPG